MGDGSRGRHQRGRSSRRRLTEAPLLYELIGYAASVLVAVSLMMSSILRLRIINLAGAVLFAVYGFLIGSIPVAAVNVLIAGVNVFYLVRIYGTKEYFSLLEVEPDSAYMRHFLSLNRADIGRYLPEYDERDAAGDLVVFVLRDVVPAGVVIGETLPDGSLRIHLDYVLPGYRDFKVGDFLFRQSAGFFRDRGIRRLIARGSTRAHVRYLTRMGFTRPVGAGEGEYVLDFD